MPDTLESCYYPAMARTFRAVGAQFAAMFSYDMLATAPFNLGWQVHFLNLVTTPRKAVSALIAAQVMKRVGRGESLGSYPANTHFGNFRVSYEEDRSELNAPDAFLYSNTTQTVPVSPSALRQIAGCGSSSLVSYEGQGAYFLDKIEDGLWRLELYPDAVLLSDPFLAPRADKPVVRLLSRSWSMQIQLEELGAEFHIEPLNAAAPPAQAKNGQFEAIPGVFMLRAASKTTPISLPDRLGNIGLREFVCPPCPDGVVDVLVSRPPEYVAHRAATFEVQVVSEAAPRTVTLWVRPEGDTVACRFAMKPADGYAYRASVPADVMHKGTLAYWFEIQGETELRHPADRGETPAFVTVPVVEANAELRLFNAQNDSSRLDLSRAALRLSNDAAPHFRFHLPSGDVPEDVTASLFIGERIAARSEAVRGAKFLMVRAKTETEKAVLHLTLVEKDGSAWSAALEVSPSHAEIIVPLSQLKPAKWAILPQGYPGEWNYWVQSTRKRGKMRLENIERVQFSLRKADYQGSGLLEAASGCGVESLSLVFD
ncbi:MAG: hypothetical protein KY445_14460 [Armatimonadetes bacterium]|nr:hypothetical protein [Armatimonadota bacterium]